mmetsp:Transcript_15705/g.33015  ORF Transcript_15705/g.33015 Transcript_15705/m.33015 type:complete len:193 (-) Transcript_15705:78-656(-)
MHSNPILSCAAFSNEKPSMFQIDGEDDSLSMHLSDDDSLYSIDGERFFDEIDLDESKPLDYIPFSSSLADSPRAKSCIPNQVVVTPDSNCCKHRGSIYMDIDSSCVLEAEVTQCPQYSRLNSLEAAITQSKESHENLLAWDRSQGVKKGFSRTMSKTNSSRMLVQSVLEGVKRSLEYQFEDSSRSLRMRTMR